MKTFKQFVLSGMVISVLLISCEKDHDLSEVPISPRTDYTVANGMLVLDDYDVFDELMTALRGAEDTQSERDVIYQNLGITKNSGVNYTDHPACLRFETDAGYTSLRKAEEDVLFYALDRGDSTLNGIISDPYAKTIFNEDRSLQINTRLFKCFNSGLIVVVANEDLTAYNIINNASESQIVPGFNVRLVGVTGDKVNEYFNTDSYGKVTSSKFVNEIQVDQKLGANNAIHLVNNSFIEYSDETTPTFKWIYPDASWYVGVQPNQTFTNGDTVILISGNTSNGYDTTAIYPRECAVGKLGITQIGARTYRFSGFINAPGSNEYIVKWLFGDGNTVTGEGVHEHTYGSTVDLCNIEVTVQVWRSINNTLACEGSEELEHNPECKKRGNDVDMERIPGHTNWRMDCKIWVDGGLGGILTVGNVGSRTKAMKKAAIGWSGNDAQQLWVSAEGEYLAETPSECSPNCSIVNVSFLEETELNSGNVQRNISNPKKVFYEPNDFWSTHKMKVNGHTHTYSKTGGKLFLD